jgi:hypothetical protein
MGSITLAWSVTLAVIALAIVAVGARRRQRVVIVAGVSLLLGLAGAWVVGLPGAAIGLVPLLFLGRLGGGAPKD